MATKIEWVRAVADAIGGVPETWNPIRALNKATGGIGHYCVHKSTGCAHCYSETWQPRFRNPIRFAAQDRDRVDIFLDHKTLAAPQRWRKRRAVFACDMTDLFGDWVPDWMLAEVWRAMAGAAASVFMVLTKRPERLKAFLRAHGDAALPNVWCGVSVEDRENKARIDVLRAIPAAVRFLSLEPLLEDLGGLDLTGIRWAIVGGESGPKARPMHPDWARSLRDQCRSAGVAFFFKQWGEHDASGTRCGKSRAGRRLAGVLHDQVPL